MAVFAAYNESLKSYKDKDISRVWSRVFGALEQ